MARLFPVKGIKEDSSFYGETRDDSVLRHKTEGGYQLSRARTTRPPSRIFTTGFTKVTTEEMEKINELYEELDYGATVFEYQRPIKGNFDVIYCKFTAPIKWIYQGVGSTELWTSEKITFREV